MNLGCGAQVRESGPALSTPLTDGDTETREGQQPLQKSRKAAVPLTQAH